MDFIVCEEFFCVTRCLPWLLVRIQRQFLALRLSQHSQLLYKFPHKTLSSYLLVTGQNLPLICMWCYPCNLQSNLSFGPAIKVQQRQQIALTHQVVLDLLCIINTWAGFEWNHPMHLHLVLQYFICSGRMYKWVDAGTPALWWTINHVNYKSWFVWTQEGAEDWNCCPHYKSMCINKRCPVGRL